MTAPLYALDIETDTAASPVDANVPAGLDPRAARITSVAVYSPAGSLVFDDPDEARMLRGLGAWLDDPATDEGVVVTWNGAVFDLPYLAARSRGCGVDLGIALEHSADRPPKYEPLPGFAGGHLARVGRHDHVDVAYPYRTWAAVRDVAWSLKPVATAAGIEVISVDRERMETLSVAERMAYNLSDVVATYELAALLGADLDTHRDRLGR